MSATGISDRSSAVKALSTWANHGVIKEKSENSFVLLERAEEETEGMIEKDDDEPPGGFYEESRLDEELICLCVLRYGLR